MTQSSAVYLQRDSSDYDRRSVRVAAPDKPQFHRAAHKPSGVRLAPGRLGSGKKNITLFSLMKNEGYVF